MGRKLLPVNAPVTFLLLVFLLAPAAMLQGNNILFWLLAVLAGILVVAIVGSSWMLRGLELKRQLPLHGNVGEPLVIRYQVMRQRRWVPAFGLFIDEVFSGAGSEAFDTSRSRAWILHVGPGETVHGEAVYTPLQRGRVELTGFSVRTSFPFGMIRRSRRLSQLQHVLVYPRVHELQHRVMEALVPRGPDGLRTARRRGGGDDYFGIRQIRTGDSVRDIAWKLSAHRNDLVAIDRARPSPPRVRIVLDLSTPTDQLQVGSDESFSPRELEERAITLAASLVKAVTAAQLEVDLSVPGFSAPQLGFRGHAFHVHRLMTLLAGLDLDAPRRTGQVHVPTMEPAGLVVISPDRIRPLSHRPDAWYLTGRQLADLVVTPSPKAAPDVQQDKPEVAA